MAYTATHTGTGSISQFFSRIGNALADWAAKNAERRLEPLQSEVLRLHAMSDAELAAQGIAREDIEIRVFSRFFYC